MKKAFFPRNPEFWLYHSLGLLGIGSVDLATSFLTPDRMGFKLWVGLVLWPIFFTAATLTFRWLYSRHRIFHEGFGKLIPAVLGYATLAALLSASAIAMLLVPLLWQQFVSPDQIAAGDVSLIGIAAPIVLSLTLSGQLFIAAWAFIYIFVKERQRARESELHNLRLQNSLKQAQLASLSQQLNPHFLFNSLNNIRFVVHENPQRADHMMTAVSEILRYSLDSADRDEVELAEELAITQRFIDIVTLQYEEKLIYKVDVPRAAEQYRIPPMTLQLLVENAVKHGIEHMREGGTIAVTVTPEQEGYRVMVINPVPAPPVSTNTATGTGLANIRNRLHLFYGERASLDTRKLEREFRAELFLPKERL